MFSRARLFAVVRSCVAPILLRGYRRESTIGACSKEKAPNTGSTPELLEAPREAGVDAFQIELSGQFFVA
jgi:hypothetical protein